MTPLCEYIQQLSNTMGVTGYEGRVLEAVASILSSHSIPFFSDSFGNLLVQLGDEHAQKQRLICAHADEVGIQVQKVAYPLVWFRTFGSLRKDEMVGSLIIFENGAVGVVEKHDTGSSDQFLVRLSQPAPLPTVAMTGTFSTRCSVAGDTIKGKALDNRAGCAILLGLVLNLFDTVDTPYDSSLLFAFTREEEIGGRGIQHLSYANSFCHVVSIDATPVVDDNNVALGSGPCIKVSDGSSISDRALVESFVAVAREHSIPYQLEVNELGFSESAFPSLVSEAKCITISYPIVGMHSAVSEVSLHDVLHTMELVTQYCSQWVLPLYSEPYNYVAER